MNSENIWYRECTPGRSFILKILPGKSLVEGFQQFLAREHIHSAVIVSAIGSVRNVSLSDIKSGAKLPITAPRLSPHVIEGPLELLGLTGNIVPGENESSDRHLHIMASKSSGEVIGGHMLDAEVFASCEIVLTELLISGVDRHLSRTAGTSTLFIREE